MDQVDSGEHCGPLISYGFFLLGASGDHVFMDYYPSESEDFAAVDSSKLDTWVFEKVKVKR